MSLQPYFLPAANLVGQVLIHFLWQGSLIAGGLALGLGAARNQSSAIRHNLACLALLLMAACPVITLVVPAEPGPGVALAHTAPPGAVPTAGITPSRTLSPGLLSRPGFPWLPALSAAWSSGVMVLCLRLLGGWWRAVRRIRGNASPAPAEWQRRLQQLQERFDVHSARPIRLLESLRVDGPLVMGCLKPVILIPVGLLTGLPGVQVEALLLHELAHVRHRDHFINLVQCVVETLLFFHPAVWWVSSQIRQEREQRCDDWVAAAQGDGTILAGALLTLAEQSSATSAFALAAGGGSVADRIRHLVGAPASTPSGQHSWWRLGILAALVLVAGLYFTRHALATPIYQSTARVLIESEPKVGDTGSFDPYFATASTESIRSLSELKAVAEGLKLGQRWGTPLDEAAKRLRSRVTVTRYPNTSLFEITVSSHDREEAAELANALAERCVDKGKTVLAARIAQVQEQNERGMRDLDLLIDKANKELAELRRPGGTSFEYQEKLKDLEMLLELRRQKYRATIVHQMESPPRTVGRFEVVDAASPASRPVRRAGALW